ncbi:MAG: hypothetical protein DWB56_13630 [Candidatus Jettenia sp.]|uniref:Putative peptidyl-prolyl cis-trans isomerase n=1 Tax=Candidatus Jettenia caeni TaxID=247490 RepID=I3IQP9_9BACT|nr:peptidylprolyl isomerase [Candidatus Jettenia sp. AMX1]MBC6929975.1 hypothetical protein [Candidatus Jettenia sp.]NUN23034.1 peptidylprolyl isomerase [Candidatus Jettenia caeni]KAA0248461.1 MAG: hypothetical protein EDM77_12570 [Candidatus Jettenia sp. AMX1]MCE7881714.1 hypothetical protein [Candidatus Jettenia sp. AMX1]MCQ3928255.1 hypothetical protein [Candidatus Jettenia sp.]
MNKLIVPLLYLALTLFQQTAFSADKKYQNDVVATVNGKKILQEDISNRLSNFKDVDPDTLDTIKQEIIDQLITDILLEEFIDKQGLVVVPEEIEREIDQIRGTIGGTQSLEQVLTSIGSHMMEFKKSVKHSIALEKYFHDKLDDRMLEKFFEENKNLFNGESVKVSHILVDTRNMKTPEEYAQALEHIKNIKKEIDQGSTFDETARKYSNCPSAFIGGDLGFIQRKSNLAKSFSDTAFALQVDQVGGPVRTEYGYHLIKVTDKKEGSRIQFTSVKEKVRLEVLDAEILKLLDRLRKEAQIVAN